MPDTAASADATHTAPGCAVCRATWADGRTPRRLDDNPADCSVLYRCDHCRTLWLLKDGAPRAVDEYDVYTTYGEVCAC